MERQRVARKNEGNYQRRVHPSAKSVLPTHAPMHPLLQVQLTIGNQALQRLLSSEVIQAQLTIGQPGDTYEQEAERVAEAVMRMPEPQAPQGTGISGQARRVRHQRMWPKCEEESHPQPDRNKEKVLQADETPCRTANVTPKIDEHINATWGAGQPLPKSVREFFEPRFGHDFRQVRVHTDAKAAESARAVNALAYTVGQNVVFGAGRYAPDTRAGRRLLAHELTHVLQQGTVNRPSSIVIGTGQLLLQRQRTGVRGRRARRRAVRDRVESLIKRFHAASDLDEKNALAMKAVRLIIRAYRFLTKGLSQMRFEPNLSPDGQERCERPGKSSVLFGPGAFAQGYEYLVNLIAHELVHVRQCRFGIQNRPTSEFLGYSVEVLALGTTSGYRSVRLPPLPAEQLSVTATHTLKYWKRMSVGQQRNYWARFQAVRDKLRERFTREAPPALRAGRPPSADPFSPEHQEWLEASRSPWQKVKEILEEFDTVLPPTLYKPPYRPYPHRWYV